MGINWVGWQVDFGQWVEDGEEDLNFLLWVIIT